MRARSGVDQGSGRQASAMGESDVTDITREGSDEDEEEDL